MKKILMWCLVWLCTLWFLGTVFMSAPVPSYAISTERPYGAPSEQWEEATEIGEILQKDADDDNWASERIQTAYNVDFDDKQRWTAYLASIINWFLAISGLVALIILIVWFYKMFLASDNEEAMKNARKTVKSAVIALLVIGTAWFVVSQFFDIFFRVKNDTTG